MCVGRSLPGVQVRIAALDAAGDPTGPGTTEPGVTGEVCVAAAHVKRRYDRRWAVERATRTADGWHRTGDLGHLDADGRLWVEGRLVHLIRTADGPVTPVGPEQRLQQRPGVSAAALVGVGPVGAQQPVAVLVTGARRPGLASTGLTNAVRATLHRRGVPLAAVLVVPRLPTDIRHRSKVDRAAVAAWAERVLAGGPTRIPW